MQISSQGGLSPADLPFDLTAELGEDVAAELKSPGVYYIRAKKKGDIPSNTEVYVVTADAPAISEKARPEIDAEDSLYTTALYGAEEHPDYFGAFPSPFKNRGKQCG